MLEGVFALSSARATVIIRCSLRTRCFGSKILLGCELYVIGVSERFSVSEGFCSCRSAQITALVVFCGLGAGRFGLEVFLVILFYVSMSEGFTIGEYLRALGSARAAYIICCGCNAGRFAREERCIGASDRVVVNMYVSFAERTSLAFKGMLLRGICNNRVTA